jgi:sugar lactone lactonase YvrE
VHVDSERRAIAITDLEDNESGPLRRIATSAIAGRPDGIAMDAEDGVWVAFLDVGCVARFLLDGQLDRVLDLPTKNATSVCFIGKERDRLLVTTLDNSLDPALGACAFALDAGVVGAPVPVANI